MDKHLWQYPTKSLAKTKTICQLDIFGRSNFSTIFQTATSSHMAFMCFFFSSGRSKAKVRPTISKVRSPRTFFPTQKTCVGKVFSFFGLSFFSDVFAGTSY